jgi:chromosome partitioning protein
MRGLVRPSPVGDLLALLGDVVPAIGVDLERHGGRPSRLEGYPPLPAYSKAPDRATYATRWSRARASEFAARPSRPGCDNHASGSRCVSSPASQNTAQSRARAQQAAILYRVKWLAIWPGWSDVPYVVRGNHLGDLMSAQRIVMLSSPKGGVGKSSITRNLLVLAAQAGRRVLGIDFDQQGTLATWAARRERARASLPQLVPVPVVSAKLDDWRSTLDGARKSEHDFIVIDTPPSIELNFNAILSIGAEANLTVVPSQQTQDDVDSITPWMKLLCTSNANAVFILNKANRRTRSYGAIRAKLLSLGSVCPVEIPQLEEIPFAAGKGLGVMDLSKPASGETFQSLWTYLSREVDR